VLGEALQRRRLAERPGCGMAVEVDPGEIGMRRAAPGAFDRLPRHPNPPERQQ